MEKAPPVLARVRRGARVESLHRGDTAVVDEDGRLLASAGDPSRRVFVRSAAKPFQAMPLLEAGGVARFGLPPEEIALLCASHAGEPRHVRRALDARDGGPRAKRSTPRRRRGSYWRRTATRAERGPPAAAARARGGRRAPRPAVSGG